MKRRDFLRIMGALTGSTFLSSCGSDEQSRKLVSYILPPEEGVIPGEAVFLPSTCTECEAGCGLSVRVREGWPVKLEGAPGHPVNDGTLCMRGQASISRLYHPDRIKGPMARERGGKFRAVSWEEAFSMVGDLLESPRGRGKTHMYLSGRTTGSLSGLIGTFCERLGIERLPEFEVFSHSQVREANRILFGHKEVPRYRIEESDFLLTLGADIIETHISPVAFSRELALARENTRFKWYHVEPHMSLTGANSDRRFVINPKREKYLLSFLLWEIMQRGGLLEPVPKALDELLPRIPAMRATVETGITPRNLRDIADRLAESKRPLVIAGGVSTAHEGGLEVALLTGLVQWFTGAVGNRAEISLGENYGDVGSFKDMESLTARLGSGDVGVIFISRTNPAFSLPGGYAFKKKVMRARFVVGMGDFQDETMAECDLVLPLSHSLESWGDGEQRKGLRNLIRPAVAPLYDTLEEGEILIRLLGIVSGEEGMGTYREYLFREWERLYGEEGRERFLDEGFIEVEGAGEAVSLDSNAAAAFFREGRVGEGGDKPVLILAPSIRTYDGRSRNLPLLSEIPDPLTTITYGPWISVSAETAENAGVRDKDQVKVSTPDWSAFLPVKIQPGLQEDVFVVCRDVLDSPPLHTEKLAGGTIDYLRGVRFFSPKKKVALPILSGSFSQMGRGIIPDPVHRDMGHKEHHGGKKSLYADHEHENYRWAMAIDLQRCIGCAACVAACYVENNVPVVGKREHVKGREMSWLRIEPFYEDEDVDFIPMMCQQCHYAPCEPVCPVYAAYHNHEGLNVQVYNRCVGTRYCANNCPYKVRRFNWFNHRRKKPLHRMVNPDISVRGQGVMEKCTFCIQRITAAKDTAKDESRKVRDGEVVTACAQSCPAGAITFGNLLDEESAVHRLAKSQRTYRVFEALGTEPSVYYLMGERPRHGA